MRVPWLVDRFIDAESNPTFSLGVFRFASLAAFLRNTPASFIGLTPEGDINRRWAWTLVGGYVQDEIQVRSNLSVNAGVRVEGATVPRDPRDVRMPDLRGVPAAGTLFDNPGPAVAPRFGAAWNVRGDGRTSIRGGYGLFFKTATQQDLIVTVTNPPATPRVVIASPTFPVPPFERGGGISVRPIQVDIQYPRAHMWNVNVQQQVRDDWTIMVGYAGSRGRHLWRSSDVNVPAPLIRDDGTAFYAAGLARPNPAFSAIELKSSDGDSWYKALVVNVRRRWRAGLQLESSYTWSKAEDTTQNATFFSDSTTSVVSAMPEVVPGHNKGLADFHAGHHWTASFIWQVPRVPAARGVAGALINGWQISGVGRLRSGHPLTVFVQGNRSRSLWSPSLGPGTGPDRPSWAPGRGPSDAVTGNPAQWFDPAAFVLPPAGTFGTVRRNELIGPDLRTLDLAAARSWRWAALGPAGRGELRLEIFNVLNRVNYGAPALVAFSGVVPVVPDPNALSSPSSDASPRSPQASGSRSRRGWLAALARARPGSVVRQRMA